MNKIIGCLLTLLFLSGCAFESVSRDVAEGRGLTQERDRASKKISFIVVKDEVDDLPLKANVSQEIVVTGVPSRKSLKAELLKRYREVRTRKGFKYYDSPTSIYLYIYGTKEQALAGQGLWVAMLLWRVQDGKPEVSFDNDRLAELSTSSKNRFGISEAKRKQVFRELAGAEDRAMVEAMAQVPSTEFIRQSNLERQLGKKYKGKLARKYGITRAELSKIGSEGVKKGWVAPPAPKLY